MLLGNILDPLLMVFTVDNGILMRQDGTDIQDGATTDRAYGAESYDDTGTQYPLVKSISSDSLFVRCSVWDPWSDSSSPAYCLIYVRSDLL